MLPRGLRTCGDSGKLGCMALMKTSNPALSSNTFRLAQADSAESMTISGAVNKTGILLICAVLTAAWSWNRFTAAPETAVLPLMIGGIGGLHRCPGHHFQEGVGAGYRASVCAAGGPGAGQRLGDV